MQTTLQVIYSVYGDLTRILQIWGWQEQMEVGGSQLQVPTTREAYTFTKLFIIYIIDLKHSPHPRRRTDLAFASRLRNSNSDLLSAFSAAWGIILKSWSKLRLHKELADWQRCNKFPFGVKSNSGTLMLSSLQSSFRAQGCSVDAKLSFKHTVSCQFHCVWAYIDMPQAFPALSPRHESNPGVYVCSCIVPLIYVLLRRSGTGDSRYLSSVQSRAITNASNASSGAEPDFSL